MGNPRILVAGGSGQDGNAVKGNTWLDQLVSRYAPNTLQLSDQCVPDPYLTAIALGASESGHSYRSVITGSTRAARKAGI
jgi:hypothetical protein